MTIPTTIAFVQPNHADMGGMMAGWGIVMMVLMVVLASAVIAGVVMLVLYLRGRSGPHAPR